MEEQEHSEQQNSGSKAWIGVIAVVVIVAVAGFAYKQANSQKQQTLGATDQQSPKVVAKPTTTLPYRDGTFTAEGDYMTHVGQKHISVKLTLKNGVIADADVTNEADDPMSMRFQDAFIGGYKQFVVGKKIDEVKVGKVASSSLTPVGFNNALDAIKKQAQAQS